MSGPDLSDLHGLIIGIDNYKDPQHQCLKGCVNDATSVFNYFTGPDLNVPEDQFVCLFDHEATRDGIFKAFQDHLINNEKINRSDPIVIYFSGHSDRLPAPAEWYSDDGYAGLILPYDAGSRQMGYTHGIPDRTLGALIHRLHEVKGDNILFGQRHNWSRHPRPSRRLQKHRDSLSSGLFTTALIQAFGDCDLATTSYAGLMRIVQKKIHTLMSQVSRRLPVLIQTPQCEGQKQDRLLFRTQFALCKGMIPLDYRPENNRFHIKAGNASGIQSGTVLDVYLEGYPTPLVRLVATQVSSTTAILNFQDKDTVVEIPQNAYVVVAKYTGQAIRIFADDRLCLPEQWQDVFYRVKSLPIDIVWAKPGEASDLVLETTERGVLVNWQDPYVIRLEPRDIVLG
ncbi:hypothetical protein FRC10_007124, partial [Ceratobasidium sp. 414]